MNGEERREKLLQILKASTGPVSGGSLSSQLKVSRQVIVQDIALLRAEGKEVVSTSRGYVLRERDSSVSRVFKVLHSDEETVEELELIVDLGGRVEDVFVYHKVYSVIRGELNLRSRLDIRNYMEELKNGKSSLLKNVTSGYHYHTVTADRVEILDLIQQELEKRGFLAGLQDYEPVDFWKKKSGEE